MKKRRTTNRKLTSERDQQKKFIIHGVVKRGANPKLQLASRSAWKIIKSVFKLALLAAVGLGVWIGYDKLFWRNPDYALSDIAFTTDGSLSREQALAVAHLSPGRNIYSYRLDESCEALKALPQVENAEIRRYLPNRVEVTVTERKPVAWVTDESSDERTHLLDARGLVFQPKRALPEYDPLPIISGVELGDLAPGKPIRKSELVAALELLRRSRESGGETQVLSIDVSRGYCIVATDQRHAKLTFGLDDIAGQLENLSMIRRTASLRGDEIATVNLMVQKNIPVTLVQRASSADDDDVDISAIAERPRVLADPPRGAKPSTTTPSPAKKAEPTSPKNSPGPKPITKPFRRAA